MQKIMNMLKVPDDEAIVARPVTRSIASAQKRVEGHHFDIRKHLLEYDNVMNQQRTAVYQMRRIMMHTIHWEKPCLDFLSDVLSGFLDRYVRENAAPADWDLKSLHQALCRHFGFSPEEHPSLNILLDSPAGGRELLSVDQIVNPVKQEVKNIYDQKKELWEEHFKPVVQMILLQTLDARWKEHLENIDHLKEGINLRAYAQKDPLVEYKKEAFFLFEQMNFQVAMESTEKIFKIQIQLDEKEDYNIHKELPDNWDYEKPAARRDMGLFSKNMEQPEVCPPGPPSGGQGRFNREQRRRQQKLKKKRIKI